MFAWVFVDSIFLKQHTVFNIKMSKTGQFETLRSTIRK